MTDSMSGNVVNTLQYGYDSLSDILSETTGNLGYATSVQYSYDKNGRRLSTTASLNGLAQPVVNYGYDCDDRLIGMSNNGSAIQSCSPTKRCHQRQLIESDRVLLRRDRGAPMDALERCLHLGHRD
jgi:hypothetical protein